MAQLPINIDNIAADADQVMTINYSLATNETTQNGHTLTVFQQPLGKLSINYKLEIAAPLFINR